MISRATFRDSRALSIAGRTSSLPAGSVLIKRAVAERCGVRRTCERSRTGCVPGVSWVPDAAGCPPAAGRADPGSIRLSLLSLRWQAGTAAKSHCDGPDRRVVPLRRSWTAPGAAGGRAERPGRPRTGHGGRRGRPARDTPQTQVVLACLHPIGCAPCDNEPAHSGTSVIPVKGTESSRAAVPMRVSWAAGDFPGKCSSGWSAWKSGSPAISLYRPISRIWGTQGPQDRGSRGWRQAQARRTICLCATPQVIPCPVTTGGSGRRYNCPGGAGGARTPRAPSAARDGGNR